MRKLLKSCYAIIWENGFTTDCFPFLFINIHESLKSALPLSAIDIKNIRITIAGSKVFKTTTVNLSGKINDSNDLINTSQRIDRHRSHSETPLATKYCTLYNL